MSIPFTVFDGYLKSIRLNTLEPYQQVALEFAFGEFFKEEQINRPGLESISNVLEHLSEKGFKKAAQNPYRYRRFSGGGTLPRGRYYSIATDATGQDGSALVQEVSAYTDHSRSGRVIVFDSYDVDATRRISETFHLASFNVPESSLVMLFFHDSHYPSPLVDHLVSKGLVEVQDNVYIAIQYRVEKQQIAKIVDLRLPTTQQWLYENITRGLPGVSYYYYPNYLVHRLVIHGDRPQRTDENLGTGLAHDGSGKAIWYPHRTEWQGQVRDGPADFFGLLPFLIYRGRGGSPITEAIGRWLRQLGADGMIYPSVRTDVACECHGNVLRHATGWNFVDYRNAGQPDPGAWIIMAPDSWWGLIGAYTDVRRAADGESWTIVGNYRNAFEWFIEQQKQAAQAFANRH